MVAIHELIAWGLDDYPSRISGMKLSQEECAEKIERAKRLVAERGCYEPCNALLNLETAQIQQLLAAHAQRTALQQEYEGLDWTLGIVDLRCLLAFQRRLVFDPELQLLQAPQKNDWAALFSMSLGATRATKYNMKVHEDNGCCSEFILKSSNPDLQLRAALECSVRRTHPLFALWRKPIFRGCGVSRAVVPARWLSSRLPPAVGGSSPVACCRHSSANHR